MTGNDTEMTFLKKSGDPDVRIRLGLLFLALASLAKWFLPGAILQSEDLSDGITGLLYGLSIGFMLIGIRSKQRSCGMRDD